AIASPLAAEIYDLEVLAADVQDAEHNTTRFLVLSLDPEVPPYDENETMLTSLVFRVRNIPAALYKALGGFATNGISMAKLESYVGEGFQVARFYAEVEGHPDSRALQLALEELEFFAEEVRVLGTYKAHEFRKQA
ncbi:MAG: prephenate dehydratase domain-containing protein, partial [Pseudomonadota bacterium]|nr:prephenate dehydratase domain-containing protein [Pseudomonadota bacterium]